MTQIKTSALVEWRTLDEYPEAIFYADGRIQLVKDRAIKYSVLKAGDFPKCTRDRRKGSMRISLRDKDGRRAIDYVHRLICEAFHGPAPKGLPEVRHINDDRTDNRAKNLRWARRAAANRAAWPEGKAKAHREKMRESGRAVRRYSQSDVIEICQMQDSGVGYPKIAARFGSSPSAMRDIVKGRTYQEMPRA